MARANVRGELRWYIGIASDVCAKKAEERVDIGEQAQFICLLDPSGTEASAANL
jgi:hypothetical protein